MINHAETSGIRTIDQARAAFAWKVVNGVADKRAYKQAVRKAPSLVQNAGLGQAAAFIKAAGGAHELVFTHLQEWLCGGNIRQDLERAGGLPRPLLAVMDDTRPSLLKQLGDKDVDAILYRTATREALAILSWLKRIAEAVTPREIRSR